MQDHRKTTSKHCCAVALQRSSVFAWVRNPRASGRLLYTGLTWHGYAVSVSGFRQRPVRRERQRVMMTTPLTDDQRRALWSRYHGTDPQVVQTLEWLHMLLFEQSELRRLANDAGAVNAPGEHINVITRRLCNAYKRSLTAVVRDVGVRPTLFGCWDDVADIARDFGLSEGIPARFLVLLGAYEFLSSYEGRAFVLLQDRITGALFEVNGLHDSISNLAGQWEPEKTTVKALRYRMEHGTLGQSEYDGYAVVGFAGPLHAILDALEAISGATVAPQEGEGNGKDD